MGNILKNPMNDRKLRKLVKSFGCTKPTQAQPTVRGKGPSRRSAP